MIKYYNANTYDYEKKFQLSPYSHCCLNEYFPFRLDFGTCFISSIIPTENRCKSKPVTETTASRECTSANKSQIKQQPEVAK